MAIAKRRVVLEQFREPAAIVCPGCRVKNWDPVAAAAHARWCSAAPPAGLVGEDRKLDQLLLEVATVPRPADTAARAEEEVARLNARDTAIDAARQLLAGLLRDDRNGPGLVPDLSLETLSRLDAARDCLRAERRSRRSAK